MAFNPTIGPTVVLRPGDPNPAVNVYTTWEEAYGATSPMVGSRILQIDTQFIDPLPATIPAGTYDLADIYLTGNLRSVSSKILLQALDGVKILNLTNLTENIRLFTDGNTSSVIDVPAGGPIAALLLQKGAELSTISGVPMILIAPGASFAVAGDFGGIVGDGITPVVEVGAGGAFLFIAFDQASVADNAITGAGIFQADIASSSGAASNVQSVATTIIQLSAVANQTGYTPLNPADWAGTPPDDAAEAMDRMAAVLFANFGPIP